MFVVNSSFYFILLVGNKPPGLVPAKAMYMTRDLERLRDFYQIPFNHPSVSLSIEWQGSGLTWKLMIKIFL